MQHQLIDNAESVITQFNINDGAYVSPGRVCWSGLHDEKGDGGRGGGLSFIETGMKWKFTGLN